MWSRGRCSRNDTLRTWRCLDRCTPNLTLSLFHPFIAGKVPGSKDPRPWHCCSAHPVWWGHHPGWCLPLNSSPTPPDNPVRNKWHREERCHLSTQHDDTLLSPSANFGMWWCPWCPHLWRLAGWSSYGLWAPCGAIGQGVSAWILLTSQTLMTLMRKLMLSFGHFWIHDLMRVKVTGVGLPIVLVAPSLDLCLSVVPNHAPGSMAGGQVWLLSGWICHLKPCFPLLALAMHEGVVVLLFYIQ